MNIRDSARIDSLDGRSIGSRILWHAQHGADTCRDGRWLKAAAAVVRQIGDSVARAESLRDSMRGLGAFSDLKAARWKGALDEALRLPPIDDEDTLLILGIEDVDFMDAGLIATQLERYADRGAKAIHDRRWLTSAGLKVLRLSTQVQNLRELCVVLEMHQDEFLKPRSAAVRLAGRICSEIAGGASDERAPAGMFR